MSEDLSWLFRPRCFLVIDPEELALPHNPARCDFYDRALWSGRRSLAEQRTKWLEVIGPRWRRCAYHAADWRRVATAACWVLEEQLQVNAELWSAATAYLARLPGGALPSDEAAFAESLFFDPITWVPGEDAVEDGQHRGAGCASQGRRPYRCWTRPTTTVARSCGKRAAPRRFRSCRSDRACAEELPMVVNGILVALAGAVILVTGAVMLDIRAVLFGLVCLLGRGLRHLLVLEEERRMNFSKPVKCSRHPGVKVVRPRVGVGAGSGAPT